MFRDAVLVSTRLVKMETVLPLSCRTLFIVLTSPLPIHSVFNSPSPKTWTVFFQVASHTSSTDNSFSLATTCATCEMVHGSFRPLISWSMPSTKRSFLTGFGSGGAPWRNFDDAWDGRISHHGPYAQHKCQSRSREMPQMGKSIHQSPTSTGLMESPSQLPNSPPSSNYTHLRRDIVPPPKSASSPL